MRRSLFLSVFTILFILMAIPMLLMVACDDDDDDEPTPTPTHTATPIPPTPTPTPTPAAEVFFYDDFDSYETGSTIGGQGGWEPWGGASAADGTIVDEQACSPPNSLAVRGGCDMTHSFSGVDSGMWYAKVMTYVPSDQTGNLYFIILNEFTGNGGNWSSQITMSAASGTINSLGGSDYTGTGSLPLITDQWVELRVEIDLGNNEQKIYYNNEMLDQLGWTSTGTMQVAAFDLFSDGSSNSYMDNVYLDDEL